MSKYVLPATIANRFGITEAELMRSRRRGLFPGSAGYVVTDADGARRLVFPATLTPADDAGLVALVDTDDEDNDE